MRYIKAVLWFFSEKCAWYIVIISEVYLLSINCKQIFVISDNLYKHSNGKNNFQDDFRITELFTPLYHSSFGL